MDYWLKLPAWRKRLEGEKAAKRYEAERLLGWPPLEVPGVLPPLGQTGHFVRRFWDASPNQFAWLNDDFGPLRMPPLIMGGRTVPTTTASPPPGLPGVTTSFAHMRRRRHY